MMMKVALELQKEWDISMHDASGLMKKTWVSCSLLRPFLFFIIHRYLRKRTVQIETVNSMHGCFVILLENLNSTGDNLIC